MTQNAKTNIKLIIPYLSFLLSFLPVFYMLFAWGQYTEKNEGRMFKDAEEKNEVIGHSKKGHDAYLNVHMDREEKDRRYVTKEELKNVKVDVIDFKKAVIIIQKDIKEILKNQKNK